MAAEINATVGASDANSYLTLTTAQSYADSDLAATDWDAATADKRTRALITATRHLSALRFIGSKTASTQALPWPRKDAITSDGEIDDDVIPAELLQAQWEIANALIQGVQISGSAAGTSLIPGLPNEGLQRVKLDVMEVEWKPGPSKKMTALSVVTPGLLSELIVGGGVSTVGIVRS